MSEQDESGERTELPTEKRRREAREQGNIPRSRELATAAVFGAGVLAIIAMGPSLARNALGWMKIALTPDAALMRQPDQLFGHVGLLLLKLLAVIAPVAGICVLAGLVAPVAMSGLQFSQKALMPDFKRLSPAAGLKRLYGAESVAELLKSLLRVALIGGAAAICVKLGLNPLRELLTTPLADHLQDLCVREIHLDDLFQVFSFIDQFRDRLLCLGYFLTEFNCLFTGLRQQLIDQTAGRLQSAFWID